MALKIKANAVQNVKAQMNLNVAGGKNAHPWVDPVEAIWGEVARFPDLIDFFSDVSHKKGLRQQPLKLSQVFDLIIKSYDEETNKITPKNWQKLLGVKAPVEGSAYLTSELNEVASKTKEHYALVCVPSGFDWAARGINMKGLMLDTGWWDNIPRDIQNVWDIAILIVIWVVYEGLGLGGLCEMALIWHRLMREYGKKGKLSTDNIPDELKGKYVACGDDYSFLESIWMELLQGQDIPDEWATNKDLFEVVMFLANCREVVWAVNNGCINKDSAAAIRSITLDGLEPEQTRSLACACQVMRDGAKGKLTLQDVLEKSDELKGALNYLLAEDDSNLIATLQELPGTEVSLASVVLLDQCRLMQDWILGRQDAKFQESMK